MTAGELCARPNGASGLFRLGSTRSLSRQRRFRSVEDLQMQSSAEESIPDLSHSSAQSTSPVGDYPEQTVHPSVLQKAAWFLNRQQAMEVDRPRVLANVSKTIQRTSSQINKTRLYHIFYIVAMPLYTIFGALIFQWADGEHDERLIREYNNRCQAEKLERLAVLKTLCVSSGEDCFHQMKALLESVEKCYKDWHAVNRTVTLSMNNFVNANVYAFSVYTSIGYGNVAADTSTCRIFTVFYAVIGLSLFFGFVKEAGALFRVIFINTYNRLNSGYKKWCKCRGNKDDVHTTILARPKAINLEDGLANSNSSQPVILISDNDTKRAHFSKRHSSNSLFGQPARLEINEQRRVFIAGLFVLLAYILLVSFFFMLATEFDYFTSVYFLFNSIALIGFGDVFPGDPVVILGFSPFIIIGVSLFTMCYFILQEEISHKAMEASRKARKSISKYSHTIIQHSRSAWSRRNSPLLEGGSPETDFERMRKRRQSAPAVTLTVPSRDRRNNKSPDRVINP